MQFSRIKTIVEHSSTSIMAPINVIKFFTQLVDKIVNMSPSRKAKTASM